jgi:hypothetical protein
MHGRIDRLPPFYDRRLALPAVFFDGWEGPPAALQIALDEATPERIRKSRSWPKTPAQMGNRIKRAKPLLEHKGFTVERRHSGTRTIIIVPPRQRDNEAR